MPNDASTDYILAQLNAGYSFDQIVSALVASGWNQADATAKVASVARSRQNVPPAVAVPRAQNDLAALAQNSQHVSYQSAVRPGNVMAAQCPYCHRQSANKVSWTWWGGLVGPAIMGIVKCNFCRRNYRKNGKTEGGAIGIYMGVSFGIAFLIFIIVFAASLRH